MTAKELLLQRAPTLTEEQAAAALRAVEEPDEDEWQTAPLPEGWGETLTGEPMPDVAAAVRRSREGH
jgi:hypothetical protein